MNQPKSRIRVSVCVATFNQAQYLERCIESVFAQRAVSGGSIEIEVVVGDDASTDTTSEILSRLQLRHGESLIIIRHEKNVGPACNYLSVLSNATGDYIAHLDGDDFWEEAKLGAQIDYLLQHPASEAVCTNARVIDNDEGECGIFTNVKSREIDLTYLSASGNFLNHSSLLYRRSALPTVLRLNPPFIDYAVLLTLAHRAPIGFINQPLVCYRAGLPGSIQRLNGNQVQDLYLDALLTALPALKKVAARNSAANYLAYRFVFSLRGKAAPLNESIIKRLMTASGASRGTLIGFAAVRAGVIAMKAFAASVSRNLRGLPFVHHPRY